MMTVFVVSTADPVGVRSYYDLDAAYQPLSDAVFNSTKDAKLSGIATGATANSSDATLLDRANHTGSQTQSTITSLTSDLALKAPLASPTFTGTVTAAAIAASGVITSATSLGFAAGAGGAPSAQSPNKTSGVTLNKAHGKITMANTALAAATIVSHTLTNSTIAATDQVICSHVSGGTSGAYTINAFPAAGSAVISVRNNTAGSLSDAIVYRFTVIKGVDS